MPLATEVNLIANIFNIKNIMISIGIKAKFSLWEIYFSIILKYDCQMVFLFYVNILYCFIHIINKHQQIFLISNEEKWHIDEY